MSKFMPPKPLNFDDWEDLHKERFNSWFKLRIAPLFENAIEVYSTGGDAFHKTVNGYIVPPSHRALLINIQTIKEPFDKAEIKEWDIFTGYAGENNHSVIGPNTIDETGEWKKVVLKSDFEQVQRELSQLKSASERPYFRK